MLEDQFFTWLLKKYDNKGTANSRKTNCLTVCRYEGDLDVHYAKDLCRTIIEKLSYSTDDQNHNRPPKHKIPINGIIRTGTATLKQAVKLYVEFKNEIKNGFSRPTKAAKSVVKRNTVTARTNSQSNWPKWELPAEEEIYQLAQIATKYIKFLNPAIIKKITEDNIEHYEEWRNFLQKNNINPDLYLWELSPCCFPGVRRYAGSKEIAYFRKQTKMERNEIPNALQLDNNDFPKQIWSFIFRGKSFGKFGPDDYSLAHLFDHKESKNRMGEELEFINKENNFEAYFGLYTCPSNTVYIPTSLLKPTDFNLTLRRLLFQKAESLYQDYCNILPPFMKIPKPINEKWNINNFQWGNCVGALNNISIFITYRNNFMKELMEKK
jgi:hypothetical protein